MRDNPIPRDLRHWHVSHFTETVPELGHRGFIIAGAPGVGKTCLAAAIARREIESGRDQKSIRWRLASDLVFELIFGPINGRLELLSGVSRCGLLILDDIGSNKITDNADAMVQMILDRRYQAGYPTIVTTNLTPEEMRERDARIASRFLELRAIVMRGESRRGQARPEEIPWSIPIDEDGDFEEGPASIRAIRDASKRFERMVKSVVDQSKPEKRHDDRVEEALR